MPQPTPTPRICVLRLSALGDVVLAVPAVRALARAWPESRITWITSPPMAPVLRGLPENVEIEAIPKPRGLSDYLELRRRWAGRRYDLLLAMQASLRTNLLYPLIHAPIKIGFDRPQARDAQGLFVNRRVAPGDRHLLDGFMAFAAAAGVTDLAVDWGLSLDPAAMAWARAAVGEGPYLLINPSASKPERNWPLARNIELARAAVQRHGLRVVLCGGPSAAERAAAAQIAAAVPGALDLAGQTDLPRLFALIAQARVLVSPDSGPVHIARAFGVPVIGLYASARAQKTGPYEALEFTVDAYSEAVRQLLRKDPATVHWDTRMRDARAMELITVDAVLGKLEQVLGT